MAVFRKVHIPGHEENEPWRPFQHLERRYFEPGPDPFGVWAAFGARAGMMICNDRRWPETYRVMGLQGVEVICCGYNTPIHYAPDPSQDILGAFHNQLVMQAGAYQNGTLGGGGGQRGCRGGGRRHRPELHHRAFGPGRGSGLHRRRRGRGGHLRPRLVPAVHDDHLRFRAVPPARDVHAGSRRSEAGPGSAQVRHPVSAPAITARTVPATSPGRVTFTLNGGEVSVRADHPHLLAALREELDVTSPKDGCSPAGNAGAARSCSTARPRSRCQIPLAKAEGRERHDPGGRRRS